MKLLITLALILAPLTLASPANVAGNSHIQKRATTSDIATTGYATTSGGTTGGLGGAVTTVTTLAALQAAVKGNTAAIVLISGTITGADSDVVDIGSNKSVLGKAGAALVGIGLRVVKNKNVIIRNLKISKVLAPTDAIAVQDSSNVWIDHNDLSSDRDHDKDYYDGLCDITHNANSTTVSYNILHDHWKTSLIGHSDNDQVDEEHITVTLHHNYWHNVNSRTPSFRWGTGHVYNNYYYNNTDGINTRDGAQLLIQNNVFELCPLAIYSTDAGFATSQGNSLGGGNNTALVGTITTVPYSYTLDATTATKANVLAAAGPNLGF